MHSLVKPWRNRHLVSRCSLSVVSRCDCENWSASQRANDCTCAGHSKPLVVDSELALCGSDEPSTVKRHGPMRPTFVVIGYQSVPVERSACHCKVAGSSLALRLGKGDGPCWRTLVPRFAHRDETAATTGFSRVRGNPEHRLSSMSAAESRPSSCRSPARQGSTRMPTRSHHFRPPPRGSPTGGYLALVRSIRVPSRRRVHDYDIAGSRLDFLFSPYCQGLFHGWTLGGAKPFPPLPSTQRRAGAALWFTSSSIASRSYHRNYIFCPAERSRGGGGGGIP